MATTVEYGTPLQGFAYWQNGSMSNWYTGTYSFVKRSEKTYFSSPRPKPVGVEALFNGTPYVHSRSESRDGLYNLSGLVTGLVGHGASIGTDIHGLGQSGDNSIHPDLSHRLRKKIKDEKINLAMCLAEYRQTSRLFVDASMRLVAFYRRFRRGDVIGAFNAVGGRGKRKFSENWLAFQYGVRPLISDVQGALKVLDGALLDKPLVRKYVVHSKIVSDVTTPLIVSGFHGTKRIRRDSRITWTAYCAFDSGYLNTASSLGLLNPLQLAWELVPYSFVVDWFINVGDYLGSLDALAGVERQKLYMRNSYHETLEIKFLGGVGTYDSLSNTRIPSDGIPDVRLQWEPSLTWQRLGSALALLRQSRRL